MSEWLINREAVEERFGQPLTEEEWSAVTEEVAGRVITSSRKSWTAFLK